MQVVRNDLVADGHDDVDDVAFVVAGFEHRVALGRTHLATVLCHASHETRQGIELAVEARPTVPRELFESEFFGHTKGAFTGAVSDRVGRFELAHGGTLFLDEVGEIPLELQGKLLRVLQEGTFERVGDSRSRRVDVRVVTATNRDLREEVSKGHFREDLYYRLSVFPVQLPALRERAQDIPLLAAKFASESAKRIGRPIPRFTTQQLSALERYAWPGNIRELQNAIERWVITGKDETLLSLTASSKAGSVRSAPERGVLSYAQLRALERDNLRRALELSGGKVSGRDGAAQKLGLKVSTFNSKAKALGVDN